MAMEKLRGEMDKVRKSRGTDERGRDPARRQTVNCQQTAFTIVTSKTRSALCLLLTTV